MGTLTIVEFTNSGADSRGNQVQAAELPPVTVQNISSSSSSAQSAVLNDSTALIRVSSDTDCYIVVDANPTATAATGVPLAAGTAEYFTVRRGAGHKVAVIE